MESLFPFSKEHLDGAIRNLLEKEAKEKEKELENNAAYQAGLKLIIDKHDAREKKLRCFSFPGGVVLAGSMLSMMILGVFKSSEESDLGQYEAKKAELTNVITYRIHQERKLEIKDSYIFTNYVHSHLGSNPSPEDLQFLRNSLEQQVSDLAHSQKVQEAQQKIEHYGNLVIFPFGGIVLGFGLGIWGLIRYERIDDDRRYETNKLKEKYGVKQDE